MLHGHGSGWWRVFVCPDTESPFTAAGQKVLQRERKAQVWTAFRDSFSGSTLALSLRAGRQKKTCSLVGTAIPAPKCLLSLKCRRGAGKMARWSPCFAGMWIQVSVFGTHAQLSVVTGMCKQSTPWEIGQGNSKARELGVCSGERWRRDLSQNRRTSTQVCTLISTYTWCDTHPHAHTHEPVFTHAYIYLGMHAQHTHTNIVWYIHPYSHIWICPHSYTWVNIHTHAYTLKNKIQILHLLAQKCLSCRPTSAKATGTTIYHSNWESWLDSRILPDFLQGGKLNQEVNIKITLVLI